MLSFNVNLHALEIWKWGNVGFEIWKIYFRSDFELQYYSKGTF